VAAAPTAHAWQDSIDAVGDAEEVDADDCLDLLTPEILGVSFAADAGASEEEIRWSQLLLELLDGSPRRPKIGDVSDGPRDRLAAEVHGELLQPWLLQVDGSDARALGSQCQGDGTTDAAGSAGNEGDTLLETLRGTLLCYGTAILRR
jgi:hypothetical protein